MKNDGINMTYINPIISGFHPDPSICRVGNDYYLVTSTFEYFPGVPVYHSNDLVNWTLIGHCLERKSQLDLTGIKSSQGIFAPTIRYNDGTFYMITTCVGGCGHLYVTTTDPRNGWSDPIYVKGDGFDPDLFFDDDGKVYFTRQNMSGEGILMFEIDIKTGELLDNGMNVWTGYEDRMCEGPHIYKKDSWYYIIAAEGGTHTGHMVVVGRSKTVNGMYESYINNPILTHRGNVDEPIKATGHGDVFEDDKGNWWIVFLGIRQVGDWETGFGHHLGRETYLAPVSWVNGWPRVNDGKPVKELMQNTPINNEQIRILSYMYDLKSRPNDFYTRGNFDDNVIILTNKGMEINCINNTLESLICSTFMGRRQEHFDIQVEVDVCISNCMNSVCGLTVLMNEKYHYDLVCDNRMVYLRKTVGDIELSTQCTAIEDELITLGVIADKKYYCFYAIVNDEKFEIGSGLVKFLTSEVAAGFTGVFIGVFASGDNTLDDKALFTNYRYTVLDANDGE